MRMVIELNKFLKCVIYALLYYLLDCAKADFGLFDSCSVGSYRSTSTPYDQCAGFKLCEVGYYCSQGVRTACPAGTYGNMTRLQTSECTGKCPKGYWCPHATISPFSRRCGSISVYCPEGSSSPIVAMPGYYTVDEYGTDSRLTEETRSNVIRCPAGSYCTGGIKRVCPGGTYGSVEGLTSHDCSGICPGGFYCPAGSITMKSCSKQPLEYCPELSSRPLHIARGFYAVKSALSNNGGYADQKPCERGTYCLNGVRYLCPSGRFGSTLRSWNSSCSGLCTAGYYCPAGSMRAMQLPCTDRGMYCPEGSGSPIQGMVGYYSISVESLNVTLTAQESARGDASYIPTYWAARATGQVGRVVWGSVCM